MSDTLSRSTHLPDLSIFRRFFDRFSQRVESTGRNQRGGLPKKPVLHMRTDAYTKCRGVGHIDVKFSRVQGSDLLLAVSDASGTGNP